MAAILKGDISWVGPRALFINEMQVQEKIEGLSDEATQGLTYER